MTMYFNRRRAAAGILLLVPAFLILGTSPKIPQATSVPTASASVAPKPTLSPKVATPPVTESPKPLPTTATPYGDCQAENSEFAANAPRAQKEREHSLGRLVNTNLPDATLKMQLYAALCGTPTFKANRSLAATLHSALTGSNPNRPFNQAEWALQAKMIAGMIQWNHQEFRSFTLSTNGNTHYTVAATPKRGPPQQQPEMYMTYLSHTERKVMNVPLVLPNGQHTSLLLSPACGWQFVFEEQEYVQWEGRKFMRTKVS